MMIFVNYYFFCKIRSKPLTSVNLNDPVLMIMFAFTILWQKIVKIRLELWNWQTVSAVLKNWFDHVLLIIFSHLLYFLLIIQFQILEKSDKHDTNIHVCTIRKVLRLWPRWLICSLVLLIISPLTLYQLQVWNVYCT